MAARAQLATLIPIRNMSRAIKFYTKAVGGKLEDRGTGQMRNFWASLTIGDAPVWLVTPEKREKRTLAYSVFIVKNIKGFVAGLQKKGVKFQRAARMGPETKVVGPIAYDSGGASAFFKDTEGNVLMVFQSTGRM
jgi:predicted enzyme related to lactoylglutathione lyase